MYSKRAARIAAVKGYTNVYYFTGGMPEWRFFNYPISVDKQLRNIKVNKLSPTKFNEYREQEDVFILDVRSLSSRSLINQESDFVLDNSTLSGDYVAGALHCPLVYLEDNYHLIPKNRKVLITDWIMKQAPIAAKFLTLKDYQVVGILKGGTARWQAEGFPLVKGENFLHNELLCD